MIFEIFKKHPGLILALSEKEDWSMKLLRNMPADHTNFKNREEFLRKIDVSPARLVSAEIAHGNRVEIVTAKDAGKIIAGADGLIANENNLFLSITIADCLPIFLFEPEKRIAGIVHAGWKSLAGDILAGAVAKFQEVGGKPKNILVGIGPAICQKHYEVGLEVAEKFEKYQNVIKKVSPRLIHLGRKNNKIFLDLKKIAELQLLELGLYKKNIEIIPECTFELSEKYFSARRDKPKEVEAMISVIGIKE